MDNSLNSISMLITIEKEELIIYLNNKNNTFNSETKLF
jgi:hypothetical protein